MVVINTYYARPLLSSFLKTLQVCNWNILSESQKLSSKKISKKWAKTGSLTLLTRHIKRRV